MASTSKCKPASSAAITKAAAALAALLALVAAADGRLMAGPIPHESHPVAATQIMGKPEITFFPERGCGGLTDSFAGCGCFEIRRSQGYLVTFAAPGQTATFYEGSRCSGTGLVSRENACYCFPHKYRSVRLDCPAMAPANVTAAGEPQAHEY